MRLTGNGAVMPGQNPSQSNAYGDFAIENYVEITSYYQESTSSFEGGGTREQGGRSTAHPISIVKRVDNISPFIQQALRQNVTIEADFEFFVGGGQGSGLPQRVYHVNITGGRIVGIRHEMQVQPNTVDGLPFERVTIAPLIITAESILTSAQDVWDIRGSLSQ